MNLHPTIPPEIPAEEGGPKIIQLFANPDDDGISVKELTSAQLLCHHSTPLVDAERRVIECKACGAVFDGFDYMLLWARKEAGPRFQIPALRREVDRLSREVEVLKAQRAREKAKIRKMGLQPEVLG